MSRARCIVSIVLGGPSAAPPWWAKPITRRVIHRLSLAIRCLRAAAIGAFFPIGAVAGPCETPRKTTTASGAPGEVIPATALAPAALALARRFAAGATMWCVSPAWPAHARHVAVEFVHPVIVGQPGPARRRRRRARPVGHPAALGPARRRAGGRWAPPDDPEVRDLLAGGRRRGGSRPSGSGPASVRTPTAPTTLLWLEGADAGAGALAVASCAIYHVLWEMTHVCFEHPGPAGAAGAGVPRRGVHHLLGRGSHRRGAGRPATTGWPTCAPPTAIERVDVTLVGPVVPGDLVLVHAGTALSRIDPVDGGAVSPEATDFLYPFIEARRAGRQRPAGRPRARRPRPRAARAPGCGRRPSRPAAPELDVVAAAIAERVRAGGVVFTFGNGGSATDAAARSPRCSPGRRAARRSPPARWWTTRRSSPPWATTSGFELVFSRQLIAHARPGDIALGISTSGDSRQPARGLRRGEAPGPAHRRLSRATTAVGWRASATTSTTASSCGPTASTASRRPRRSWPWRCGPGSRPRWRSAAMTDAPPVDGREAAVLERIEAFRRRRPRFKRRRRHAGPRRRRQGLGGAGRRRVPRGVRRRGARRRCPTRHC